MNQRLEEPGCDSPGLVYVGGMDWQRVTALIVVAFTAGVFLWRKARSHRSSARWHAPCDCGAADSRASSESVVFRARKGGGRQVVVRWR